MCAISRRAYVKFALLFVVLLSALFLSSGPKPNPTAAAKEPPAPAKYQPQRGVYDSLAEAAAHARYGVRQARGKLSAANPAHGLEATFNAQGVEVAARGEGQKTHRWGLQLQGYGYGQTSAPLTAGNVTSDGNRVEIERLAAGDAQPALVEWYVNEPHGLEQGFTVNRPPNAVPNGSPLRLSLAASGDLRPQLAKNERRLTLLKPDGKPAFYYDKLAVWDALGKPLNARLQLSGNEVHIEIADAGAVYPVTVDPTFMQQAELTGSFGVAEDDFGAAVAVEGELAVVGAPGDFNDSGAIYLFRRTGATWSEIDYLFADDYAEGDRFGASVALQGDTIIVGAPFADVSALTDAGAAYIFFKDGLGEGAGWSQQAKLTSGAPLANAQYGASVALYHNEAVVGAPNDDPASVGSFTGAAYHVTRAGASWTEDYVFGAADGADGDKFGASVAIGPGRYACGAPNATVGANSQQGAVYTFKFTSEIFDDAKLTASDGAAGDKFGASLALSANTLLAGAPGADIGPAADRGAAYIFTNNFSSWSEQAKLTANAGFAGDMLGAAVALDGEVAVVGIPGLDTPQDADLGGALVFQRAGATWTNIDGLFNVTGAAGDKFGASVAVHNGTALVGAPGRAVGNNANQGAAYAFGCLGAAVWTQQAQVQAGGDTGDALGTSVAVSGERAIVGAPFADPDGINDQGVAYIFRRTGATWTQEASLRANDGAAGDQFGASVAIDGDRALVGAPFKDVGANADAGASYVFTLQSGGWAQHGNPVDGTQAGARMGSSVALQGLNALAGAPYFDNTRFAFTTDSGAVYYLRADTNWFTDHIFARLSNADNDHFGTSVALDGNKALVGAPGYDATGGQGPLADRGAAYVFENATGFAQTAQLTPGGDGDAGDNFGASVALHNDTALVGSPFFEQGEAVNRGAAYVYLKSGASWTQQAQLTSNDSDDDDQFGMSVALYGETALVGAPRHDVSQQSDTGAAYVFQRAGGSWSQQAQLTAGDAASGDQLGSAVALYQDTALAGSPGQDAGTSNDTGAAYIFLKNCNLPPDFMPNFPPPDIQQASPAQNVILGTAADDFTPAGSLTVAAGNVPPGLAVTNITNTNGNVSADLAATCSATTGPNSFTLDITDAQGETAHMPVLVNVTANTPPMLGQYPDRAVSVGGNINVAPDAPPADNGAFSLSATASAGFTGSLMVDSVTGVVTVANAGPAGSYAITVTATDGCDASTSKTFNLNVNSGSPVITPRPPVNVTQGANIAAAAVADVSDAATPAGNLTVTATSVPPGLAVTNITNTNGFITADIAASCAAAVGANQITFTVTNALSLSASANFTVNVAANTAPTLGSYANASLNAGASATVTPSAPPADNAGLPNVTVAASGSFTGALSVNPITGIVTINNAGPGGTYTVTVTATDACNATATATFALTVNDAPAVTPAAPAARQQGSPAANSPIATVSDDSTPAGSLTVAATTVPPGLTVTNLINSNGNVTADIAAGCAATIGANTVTLTVTDSGGLSANANFTVNVTANTPPTLGSYANASLAPGGSVNVTPSAPPADNGSVASVTAAASAGFTGAVSVNATGVVSITNANPSGNFTITLTATDNCGATANATFTLTVNAAPAINAAAPVARQQGSAGAVAAIATVSDDLTPAGNVTVTASGVPSGLSITSITNANGAITANLAADCSAAVGANTLTLTATDGNGASSNATLTVNVAANTAPTIGAYSAALVAPNGGTTVTPSAPPADNGTFSLSVAASAGFTGTTLVDSVTGAVTIANAAPAGTYNITITVTDNCGATTTSGFALTVNAAPTIIAGASIARQQGSPGIVAALATANDDLTPAGNLTVAATTVPPGLSVTALTNTNGMITASVAADCGATLGANAIVLTVTDGGGLSATANFAVNVTANTSPTLGSYANISLMPGLSTTVTPTAAPTDNGSVASVTVAASAGFAGSVTVNSAGVVSITNASPSGSYAITVAALDNCGASAAASFTLSVNGSPNINAAPPVSRQQGSAGAVSAIATVSDDLTPAGSLNVTASNIPAGLSLTNLTNANGTITATIAASCAATTGANSITLTVADGDNLTSSTTLTVNVTANTPPTLGSYTATNINLNSGATVTPSAPPADNGTFSLSVAASAGFTGTTLVDSVTGAVTIANAAPAGAHTVTVTATDNCGATGSSSFTLTVNGPPSVSVAAPLMRQQGSAGFGSTLATVSDDATPAGSLVVAATSVPNGLTVSNLTNQNGTVSASVAAACGATVGANTIVLTVTDAAGLSTTANVTVNVAANTPPTLGAYATAQVAGGQARAVTPDAAPSDNGSVASVNVAASAGFTGSVTVSATTGVVLVNNAAPAGSHTITVTATDNCGATRAASFTLQVVAPTLARVENYAAYRTAQGNVIRWQSSYEVENLGFHVFRLRNADCGMQIGEDRPPAQCLERLTPALIAGSALQVGANTALTAGNTYSWFDKDGAANSVYWIEDLDLQGNRTPHGPVTMADCGMRDADCKKPAQSSPLVSEISAENSGVLIKGYPAGSGQSAIRNPQSAIAEGADAWQQQLRLAAGAAVKIRVREVGWYRLAGAQLFAAGLPAGTDARRLQLYADGVEQPMNVRTANGGDAGALGAGGVIEFYGAGLDTRESDSRIYWLVAGERPGLRIGPPGRVAAPGEGGNGKDSSPGSANSFAYTVERRERLAYFPALHNGDAENFFGPMINDAGLVNQTLNVSQLDVSSPAQGSVSVALQGLTLVPHRVRVALNGNELGVVSFDGQERKTARFPLVQSALNEGANTVSFVAQAGADVSALDYVRVTYARRYRAESDRLLFTGNSAAMRVEGFTTPNVRVFDVTEPARAFAVAANVAPDANGYTASISGNRQNRTLLAVADGQALSPVSVAANEPSNWTNSSQGAEFVILTHRDFRAAVEPLAALRRGQGVPTAVIDVADVYDEWNAGATDANAVRAFLDWARRNWAVAPRYLLLVGDASYDPRNYLGYGAQDFMPTRLVDTAAAETASDEALVDADGDGVGEMAVGRLPVRNAAQAVGVVAKIVNYTPGAASGALFVADRPDGYDFAAANTQLSGLLPAGTPVTALNRASLSDAALRSQLINALNAGPSLVTYSGHGLAEAWAGFVLNADDPASFTNGNRLPFVVALTCLNGSFHNPQQNSLAEALLNAPNGGAVAVWASSGMTLPNDQMPLAQDAFQRLYQNSSLVRLGDALRAAKHATNAGEVRRTWILFGDPTAIVR
jgi:hypothetical protein